MTSSHNIPPCRRQGFTLLELLIVIVIIAALASLGFMAARKMMDSAAKTKNMGNLKQLATTSQIFSSEYNGILLHDDQTTVNGQRRNWAEHLLVTLSPDLANDNNYNKTLGDNYAQSLGIFADSKALKKAKGKLSKTGHNSWRTYAYNNRIGEYSPDPSGNVRTWGVGARNIHQVETPEKLILYAQKTLAGSRFPSYLQPEDGNAGDIDFSLYDGSAMVGFYDGHVEIMTKKNYPSSQGVNINPGTGNPYTDLEWKKYWYGRTTSLPAK